VSKLGVVNPYFFVVGCPRSGTTLLRRMLDAHPRLAMMPRETHFIPRIYERRAGLTAEGEVTPAVVDELLADRHFARLGIDRDALERLLRREQRIPYARFVTQIFDLQGRARGTELVGDKTPGYVRRLPTLHALWPEARFVHLIRDGRDVCLSLLEWRKGPRLAGRFSSWAEDPVSTTALWWEWHVGLGREDGLALGPMRYRELRYESLVANPERECSAVCDFLGVPYDDAMLCFHHGRERDDSERSAKGAWRPVTTRLRDWRTQMLASDVELFEAAAGELLDELGYGRLLTSPSPAMTTRAARLRESFVGELAAREQAVPEVFAR
jgi:Sulfotransferase family